MATRFTMLMQVSTTPYRRTEATSHIAGWSESVWAASDLIASNNDLRSLAYARAACLPAEAAVIGYRLAYYNLVGNRLVPTGSSTGKWNYPGASNRPTDVPQMALELSGKSNSSANSSRFCIRCVPDAEVTTGEYSPSPAYRGRVTAYKDELIDKAWKFLGRDLTQPSLRVLSIAGNVVTLGGAIGAVDGVTWLRFRHVSDDLDAPVKGAYLITAHAGNTVTLAGFPARTLTSPSGTARIDAIVLCQFGSIDVSRIVVRKVGRPFESYRGRGSKR